MNKSIFFLSFLFFVSCQNGCNSNEAGTDISNLSGTVNNETSFVPPSASEVIGRGLDIDEIVARRGSLLGNSCTLVSKDFIAQSLGLTAPELNVTNSSPRDANPTHSSCFFKWDSDPVLSNAGILLQMLRNPVGDEFPNYVPKYIESKRELGEQTVEGEKDIFKYFDGFGDDGSYSTVGGKYFWRIGDQILFGISFNTSHTPAQQYQIATTLAKAMTENYLKS